jgi:bacillithiol biosynthesis deacetylase BshB1
MMSKKLDILAFGAHPDDVELGAGGTLASHKKIGYSFGIIDLTLGELGTRGTPQIRLKEAAAAAKIMGAKIRENLRFKDGFFKNDADHQLEVIKMIRKYQPDIVICNAPEDRHPDHGRGGDLVEEACFYSGLEKIKTKGLKAWRPKQVFHYIQYRDLKPTILVDISDVMDIKMKAIKAHSSQFYDPKSKESATLISQPEFLENVLARGSYYGQYINAKYAEGFIVKKLIGVNNLFQLK